MKSQHDIALAVARMIRDGIKHDDGNIRPCHSSNLNPFWITARANNIAAAIVGEFLVLERTPQTAVAGEIDAPPPVRSRYFLDEVAASIPGQDVLEGAVPEAIKTEVTPAGRRFFGEEDPAPQISGPYLGGK